MKTLGKGFFIRRMRLRAPVRQSVWGDSHAIEEKRESADAKEA